jgi:hypothetical protein
LTAVTSRFLSARLCYTHTPIQRRSSPFFIAECDIRFVVVLILWDTYVEWNCHRKCPSNSDNIYKHVKSFRATYSLLRSNRTRCRRCVMPPYITNMAHRPYDTFREGSPNFANWYIRGMHDGEIDPTVVFCSGETWFKLTVSRYINVTNSVVPYLTFILLMWNIW